MKTYLFLIVIIAAVPVLLTFAPRVSYFKKLLPLLFSIVIISGLFIVWDIIATARGDWAFNDLHVYGVRLYGLPLEEILFFIVVPYSCIFLYETFLTYIKDKHIWYNKFFYIAMSLILFVIALVYFKKTYTMTVLLITSLVCIMAVFCFREMFGSFIYWMYMGVCIILFFIFNYILTSLPVVTYNPQAIIGVRVTTIPVEDFFYNYSLLSLYLALYLIAKKAWVRSG